MSAIFFDMDDTLYDRGVPFMQAYDELISEWYPELHAALGIANSRKAYLRCGFRGNEWFEAYQRGEMDDDTYNVHRFGVGLHDAGIPVTDEQALKFQVKYVEKQKHLAPSAEICELLANCKKSFDRVGLITNGDGAHQRKKIATLGLTRWVEEELILISGECGMPKPDPEIFRMAQRRVNLPAENLIFVGDVYDIDCKPSKELGWNTVLLKRESGAIHPEKVSDYGTTLVANGEGEIWNCITKIMPSLPHNHSLQ